MSSSQKRRRTSDYDDNEIELKPNQIFRGQVASVKHYGAFVKIPGPARLNGLVHKSQLSNSRVDDVNDVLNVGDTVWCKIISLGEDNAKISLSMKVINQGTGEDLDPAGVQTSLDEKKRRELVSFQHPKITLDAVYNTTCRKCGTKGHLAQNCFQAPGGKTYDLVDDDADPDAPASSRSESARRSRSPPDRRSRSPESPPRDKKRKKHAKKEHKESSKHKHRRH